MWVKMFLPREKSPLSVITIKKMWMKDNWQNKITFGKISLFWDVNDRSPAVASVPDQTVVDRPGVGEPVGGATVPIQTR